MMIPDGRELDYMVHTDVMGRRTHAKNGCYLGVPAYQKEWEDMRLVLNKMAGLGFHWRISGDSDGCTAMFSDGDRCGEHSSGDAPESVCHAAIKAIGV
jgi:hypothetical protein